MTYSTEGHALWRNSQYPPRLRHGLVLAREAGPLGPSRETRAVNQGGAIGRRQDCGAVIDLDHWSHRQ
jgi:hypothetical protein